MKFFLQFLWSWMRVMIVMIALKYFSKFLTAWSSISPLPDKIWLTHIYSSKPNSNILSPFKFISKELLTLPGPTWPTGLLSITEQLSHCYSVTSGSVSFNSKFWTTWSIRPLWLTVRSHQRAPQQGRWIKWMKRILNASRKPVNSCSAFLCQLCLVVHWFLTTHKTWTIFYYRSQLLIE